jgi:hypothetical protein
MNTITTRRGQSVESPYSHREAHAQLKKLVSTGELGGNFASQLANTKRPSDEQFNWCHVLVIEYEQRNDLPEEQQDLSEFVDMIERALEKQRSPWVSIDNWDARRSALSGRIWLRVDRKLVGEITADGIKWKCDVIPGIAEAVAKFSGDLEKGARAHGRATGHCCFCRRALQNPVSLHVGYGPICADTFGLPWEIS